MKRSWALRLAALFLGAAMLCGCASTFSMEELLRAPQLSGNAKSVQNALRSYLGETVQLRYPNQGDFLSPYFFGDWDGDGQTDAAVLYQGSGSANVQLALLRRNEENNWQVISTVEGLSATVDSVRLALMQGSGAEQIMVGYATAGDTYLAVYSLRDDVVETVLQQPYNQYLVEDINGDGEDDLIVLSEDSTGKTQVQVLIGEHETFTQLPMIELPEEQFAGYASLAAGRGAQGGRFLILDGWTGVNGQDLASAIFQYDAENHRMVPAKLESTDDLYNASIRYASCLFSRDMNGDGVVDVPTQTEESGVLSLTQGKRYAFVRWMDFTDQNAEKSFGLLDEVYHVYIQLPFQWEGNLLLTEAEDGVIEMYNLAGDRFLLRLRITDEVASGGWNTVGLTASRQIQVQLGDTVTELDLAELRSGIYQL